MTLKRREKTRFGKPNPDEKASTGVTARKERMEKAVNRAMRREYSASEINSLSVLFQSREARALRSVASNATKSTFIQIFRQSFPVGCRRVGDDKIIGDKLSGFSTLPF